MNIRLSRDDLLRMTLAEIHAALGFVRSEQQGGAGVHNPLSSEKETKNIWAPGQYIGIR